MKRASISGFVGLCALVSLVLPSAAPAQYFGSGALTTSDPTYHPTNASALGTGVQYYDLYQFTVSATGAFTLEVASLNTNGTPSNALDTLFTLYAGTFNPAAPGGGVITSDDFTGTLTVLPGPFASSGYTTASTGFAGTQPGSRFATTLTAGTTYFLAISSFRDTSYTSPTTNNGLPTGSYVFGISGPGTVTVVPEPATTALLLAAGGLGFVVLRRRKTA